MTPGNPVLTALAAIPVSPAVTVNSIIAVQGDDPVEEGATAV
jgi:hypothetical protein